MLPRILLALAPFLLVADASVLPNVHARDDGVLEVACNGGGEVTKVITVTGPVAGTTIIAPTGAPPAQSTTGTLSFHTSNGGNPPGVLLPQPQTSTTFFQTSTRPQVIPTKASSSAAPVQTPGGGAPAVNNTSPSSGYKNILYFTNWGIYGANYQPQQLPASQISHVLYSFADIAWDGEVKSSDTYADLEKHWSTDSWNDQGKNAYGCVKQLFLLKKKNRGMKVLLSIGGWTYSPKFAPIAATEASRNKFASSAVTLVKDWGFDGIDIDWEYPTNAVEAQNFILLLKACRQALDQYAAQHAPGYHFIITVASPAGAQNYNNMDLPGMDPWVDAWNLMAYDYAGSWDSTSGHQANLYANPQNPAATKFNTEKAVGDYLAKGIPASKIVMGLPLYGRAFESTNGIGQPYSGIGEGSTQAGVWLYRDLPRSGAQEIYDDVAKASYSYDAAKKQLISYDTVASAVTKAQYLIRKGLGGAVFWEASGDRTGAQSLVGTLATQMGQLDNTQNLLSFPASQFDNIRAGMPGA
ncbi:glycoside hydrolase family 18 protein [Coniochaeta sp. 2T2.1]|nr:glycoside hydrolase family 18 protein [Coniochaeta sp. 2T2.1]